MPGNTIERKPYQVLVLACDTWNIRTGRMNLREGHVYLLCSVAEARLPLLRRTFVEERKDSDVALLLEGYRNNLEDIGNWLSK